MKSTVNVVGRRPAASQSPIVTDVDGVTTTLVSSTPSTSTPRMPSYSLP